jgi:hypothetical protein
MTIFESDEGGRPSWTMNPSCIKIYIENPSLKVVISIVNCVSSERGILDPGVEGNGAFGF